MLTIRSLRRAAESAIHSDPTRRDDHCSRAHPGDVMAFTRRLQGPPPAIDHRGCEFGGSRPSRGVSPATGAFPATADAAAARLLDHTAASGCAQVGALSRTAFSRRHGKSDGRLFPRGQARTRGWGSGPLPSRRPRGGYAGRAPERPGPERLAVLAGGRVAAPGTQSLARLGTRGPLAGTLVALLGAVGRRPNAARTHPTARGGTDGPCASGY